MPDDDALIRTYLHEGSEASFSELVRRHLDVVFGAALRRTNGRRELAEDAAQLTFVALARNAHRLAGCSTCAGWLYLTARHAAGDLMRSEQSRKIREQESGSLGDTEPNWSDLRPELEALIEQLNPRDRDAVVLRFLQGHALSAVGTVLRISEDAARMRVDRALDKLRRLLERKGIKSTGEVLAACLVVETSSAAAPLAARIVAAAGHVPTDAGIVAGIKIMTATKVVFTAGAVIVTAALIGFAVHERNAAQQARALLTASLRNEASLRVQLQRLQSQPNPPPGGQTSMPASKNISNDSAFVGAASASLDPATITALKLKLSQVGNLGHGRNVASVGIDDDTAVEIRAWLEEDPDGVLQWLGSIPPRGNQRLHSIETVIAIEETSDPSIAFKLANTIEVESSRLNRFADVLKLWAPQDPAAARAAVQSADLTDQHREELLQSMDKSIGSKP